MKNKIFIPYHKFLSFDSMVIGNWPEIIHNDLSFVVSIDKDYNEFNYLRNWSICKLEESTDKKLFFLRLKLTYTNDFYINYGIDVRF